jgi:hypothetical protein
MERFLILKYLEVVMNSPGNRMLSLLFLITSVFLLFMNWNCKMKATGDNNGDVIDTFPTPSKPRYDRNPTWCQVHNLIAYLHYRRTMDESDTAGIYLINTDGTDKRLFFAGNLRWFDLDWSPDGNRLLVHNENGLFKISYPDKAIDTLRGPGDPYAFEYFCASFSPNGNKIVTHTNGGENGGIYIMNSDGTDYRRIFSGGLRPDWASNDSIIYARLEWAYPLGSIWIMDTSEVHHRMIYDNGGILGDSGWTFEYGSVSPIIHQTNKRIVFYGAIPGNYWGIWKLEPGSLEPELLVKDAEHPCFSPEGNQIVYTYEKEGYGNLWIINWDGTGNHALTTVR